MACAMFWIPESARAAVDAMSMRIYSLITSATETRLLRLEASELVEQPEHGPIDDEDEVLFREARGSTTAPSLPRARALHIVSRNQQQMMNCLSTSS